MARGRGLGAYLPWLYLGWAWSELACRAPWGVGGKMFWSGPVVTAEERRAVWVEQTMTAASADFTPAYGAYHLELLGAGLPGFVAPDPVSRLYTLAGGLVGLGLQGSWWSCHTSLEAEGRGLGLGPLSSQRGTALMRCKGAHWALVCVVRPCDGCP